MKSGTRSISLRLHDIRDSIAGIKNAVSGLDYEAFTRSWVVRHACERGIEIISEASRHLPPELKETAPDVPWPQIAGVWNILRHGYETISDRVIWDIITNHRDPLEDAAAQLLRKENAASAAEQDQA